MKTLETGVCVGTLAEFVVCRARQMGNNREQLEAFFREFYSKLMAVINDKANKFTLCSIMSFPKPMTFDVLDLSLWIILYQQWQVRLYHFEKKTLAKVEVNWE